MRSSIRIGLSEDDRPVIKVTWRDSEDVGDTIVKRFLEGFGSESTLASFHYIAGPQDNEATAEIKPIGVQEYKDILAINRPGQPLDFPEQSEA